ncbi:ATP-dependent nuclease [Streptomyces sp. NPDC088394]|uniref:ATP-dependent nuclease n=1 Tax=unclassified Streptomyces TaxID=2593676 RepID=UPI003427EF5F
MARLLSAGVCVYLAHLRVEDFRVFGLAAQGEGKRDDSLSLSFTAGTNVLVGENDSGKTAIVDAIRLCLQSAAADYYRVSQDDFHLGKEGRAEIFTIGCAFTDLSTEEQAVFLELLTHDRDGAAWLCVTFKAQRMDPLRNRVSVTTRTGSDGNGPALDGAARELLRATYLRPLRDAEAELRSGRGSRLSQILAGYPAMKDQDVDDFDPTGDEPPSTLRGILRRAERDIRDNKAVAEVSEDINSAYLQRFAIGDDVLRAKISVATDATLVRALERLELNLFTASDEWTRRGLGYNNALFMAAELLLLGKNELAPLLLIEEPEAHLHPQLQTRIMDLLRDKAQGPQEGDRAPVQVILTTHSPNLDAGRVPDPRRPGPHLSAAARYDAPERRRLRVPDPVPGRHQGEHVLRPGVGDGRGRRRGDLPARARQRPGHALQRARNQRGQRRWRRPVPLQPGLPARR